MTESVQVRSNPAWTLSIVGVASHVQMASHWSGDASSSLCIVRVWGWHVKPESEVRHEENDIIDLVCDRGASHSVVGGEWSGVGASGGGTAGCVPCPGVVVGSLGLLGR